MILPMLLSNEEKGLRDAIEFDHVNALKIVKMVGRDLTFINEGATNRTLNKQAVNM
jgi:hypothetical protein